jgi:F0F1-type ATP synthase membrane subunit b/b'
MTITNANNIPEIKMITFAVFEYISKKPLIPNTTKALKTKKIKISKQI